MRPNALILPDSLVPTLKHFTVIRQPAFLDLALSSLSRFNNLETLSLYWVPMQGNGFQQMKGKMKSLKKLNLRRCFNLTSTGFHHLTLNLGHLKCLELKGLHQIDRESIRLLSRANQLEDLSLRCSRLIIDDEGLTDLEFLANMRLKRLELIDAIGLTAAGIKKLVDTQEFTLESLTLSDCHLIHVGDLLPLRRLKKLRDLQIMHAVHLGPDDENLQYKMKPGGGVEFLISPEEEANLIRLPHPARLAAGDQNDPIDVEFDDPQVPVPYLLLQ